MKRIGIITIQKCDNFGADLQAYALGAKLRSMGYDAENIDYLFYKHPRHKGGKGEKPIFRLSALNRIKEFLFPILSWLKNLSCRNIVKARHARFRAWTNTHLRCGQEYRSVAALYANPPTYDIYMVGSDQVWNPRMGSNILPYFLDFVSMGARCVSYAASLGVSSLTPVVYARYLKLLSRFSFIGLRERAAERIIGAMGLSAEVKTVLDPTLLLSAYEWSQVSEKPADFGEEPYLLLYDLIPSQETVTLAEGWANDLGVNLVRIGDGAYGPGEFVWLFAHATAVVTNSFHGTAFSIIHGKPFYSVVPRGMTNASRIENVLNMLGLQDRLVQASVCASVDLQAKIDWTATNERFTSAREESIRFLIRSIEGDVTEAKASRPLACYALWNKDCSVRAVSTSGGVFSALARCVIQRGGVVFGAAFDADFHHVRHRAARTEEELAPLLMSKYVYSDATAAMREAKELLMAGKWVFFTGTPCQVAAMRSLAKDSADRLVLCDIVCHGTPRPEIFEAYVKDLEQRYGSTLTRYEFRNKDKGWNFPNIVYAFGNGVSKRVIPWLDPYFHGYSINAFLRETCYACAYTSLQRPGDVTIGDCWRVATSHPQYDDGKGVSLVLANTEKGLDLVREILGVSEGGVYDIELARLRNMPLFQPALKPACYTAFNSKFKETCSFAASASCYVSARASVRRFVMYWIKRIGWSYFKHHQ